jgi:hypothetical protein
MTTAERKTQHDLFSKSQLILKGNVYEYLEFPNWEKFVAFGNQTPKMSQNISEYNDQTRCLKNNFKGSWYGSIARKTIEELFEAKTFLNMELYKKKYSEIKNDLRALKSKTKNGDAKRTRIQFTDLERGIFCFDRAAIALRKQVTPQGDLKIVSDARKVFAIKEVIASKKRIVKLYINTGVNASQQEEELLYRGILAAIVKQELERKGYLVEINIVTITESGDIGIIDKTCIKKAENKLSENDLLCACADIGIFRSLFFKATVNEFDTIKQICPSSLGSNIELDNFYSLIEYYQKDANCFIIPNIRNEKQLLSNVMESIKIINQF